MRLEDLIKPLSPDAPCGDDLLVVDDSDFVDYYFNVEDRFPTSYFNVVKGALFDPKSIDLKAEVAMIDPLLKRSRDLRLLGIEAKFQILAGRFKGFVDVVQSMASLLETFPQEVHPVDPLDRRNAVEELNSIATIVAPLEYAVLITDKRIGDITYRAYGTGVGKVAPREGEEAGNSSNIIGALSSSENAKLVEALFEQLTALKTALKSMTAVFLAGPKPATPQLGRFDEKLDDLIAMVQAARPDLGKDAEQEAAGAPEGDIASGGGDGRKSGTTFTIAATPAEVPDHRAAFRLLQSIEKYFVKTEPASLALLLVVQARLLMGRPLVEALDILIEDRARYASISFGSDNEFSISISQMRDLSNQANIPTTEGWDELPEETVDESHDSSDSQSSYDTASEPPAEGEDATEGATEAQAEDGVDSDQERGSDSAPEPELPAPLEPRIAAPTGPVEVISREHAGMMLKQIEEFFKIREPASPIPMLLFKARSLLAKDFHELVRELIPPSS